MSKYHIIGDQDTVLGYLFAGLTGDIAENPAQAREAFRNAIASEEPGVLLITQCVEDMIEEEVTAHRLAAKPPYLAVIPDVWNKGRKRKSLQEMISEAVGIKLVDAENKK